MARYKEYSYEQTKLIPIAFSQQILPGTFEYTLNYLIDHESAQAPETFTAKMKRKIDSLTGRHIYSQRLGTVEPVFANICSTLGLRRFSLRGKTKVNTQWKLFSIVHILIKIHRYGPGFA